jgi:hypothetical protein
MIQYERVKKQFSDTDLPGGTIVEHRAFQSNDRLTVDFWTTVGLSPVRAAAILAAESKSSSNSMYPGWKRLVKKI